jgi:hypothetical protein
MPCRFLFPVIAAIALTSFDANRACAHDLRGRVTLLPDSIKVEAWFSDETPAQGASVSITLGKSEVATGKTDDTGVCLLPTLKPGHYEAEIELIGHKEFISFQVSDTSGNQEFMNWRMNQTLGFAIGFGGLITVSCAYSLINRLKRNRSSGAPAATDPELNRSPFADPAADIPPSSHK